MGLAFDDPRASAPAQFLTDLQHDLQTLSDPVAKEGRVDHFLAAVAQAGGAPLRQDGDLFFLYRLNAGAGEQAVALAGDFNGWQPSDAMVSVQGTSLWVAQRHFADSDRHQYKFVINPAGQPNWITDPLNPWVQWDTIQTNGLGQFNSVVTMPVHPLTEPATRREHFASQVEGNMRDVFIFLPHQYFEGGTRFSVIYNHDGNEAITRGHFDQVLQNALDDGTVLPAMLVGVALNDQAQRNDEYTMSLDPAHPDVTQHPRGALYQRLLADELVPFIDAHFRTQADAAHRVVAGQSLGGLISYYVAYQRPSVFGLVAGQSSSFFWNSNEIINTYGNGAKLALKAYVDSGTGSGQPGDDDNLACTSQMWETLETKGYPEMHVRVDGAQHDWGAWHDRYPCILWDFFASSIAVEPTLCKPIATARGLTQAEN